jgi:hypothetical protein
VATIKKNNNIKTISGKEAVEIAGKSPPFFFLNFDIALSLVNFLSILLQRASEDTSLLPDPT